MVDAVLERLKMLHPKVIDLSLERVYRLLQDLGEPQNKLPPVIHVAGTNGKGSTVAFLRAIYEAAGYRVHTYTSPHLVRFAERIRVAGRLLEDGELMALLEECEQVNAGQPITFFEITTAAAFLAFARTPADLVLLETGLGGRLDATNVVDKPALTVITPISLDHQQYLGERIETIAAEKAAIMKRGIACIVADQPRGVNKVLEARSLQYGVPLLKEGEDFYARSHGDDGMVFKGRAVEWALPLPGLQGKHQMRNAAVALACVEWLREAFPVTPEAVARGVATVEWPARLQRLTRGPLVDLLPHTDQAGAGWELWLDGGHNPAAGKALAQHFRNWSDKPLYAVFGMLGSKDADGFLKPLAARFYRLRAVTIPGEDAALTAEDACAAAKRQGMMDASPAADLRSAVASVVQGAPPGRVLICGSLYLAGKVLAENV
jgi:dihydrofolate synthase/folylpolyglutamate synthase